MNTGSQLTRRVRAAGFVAMIVGAVDPFEGSVLILIGGGLVALGAFLARDERRLVVYWAAVFALIAAGVAAMWGLTAAPRADDLASRLAARVPQLMDAAVVPGAQLAVIRDGTLAWQGAFGLANAQSGARVTDASVFEAASLTKPLFAYAALKLVDEGRLDLDTPLVTYLPGRYDLESDDPLKRVTARHVLSHRTGFPNWRPGGEPLKIHFTPGERFSYSGEGFVYLGAVIERITGETAEAFVNRCVFKPLGMRSSSLVWKARYEPLKVFGHGTIGSVTGRNMAWKPNPAASLHTTAEDYARFVAAAMAGVGLRPETARQMLSPQARLDEAGLNTATVPPTGRIAGMGARVGTRGG